MKKIVTIAVVVGLTLAQAASAQVYDVGAGSSASSTPPTSTCTLGQTGVFDLTNTCNDIYLLTGSI